MKRNEFKVRLREAEREHVHSQLISCQGNISKWKDIKNCIHRKVSMQAVYSRDVKIIVDEFNEFFSTVGHVQSELISCQRNSSKWKVIRNCIPRKLSMQAVYSRDVKIIADEFNEFFSTVGARAAKASAFLAVTHDLPTVTSPMVSDQSTPESEKFHFQAVSENEIKRIVMSFQSNKVPEYEKFNHLP